LAIGADAGTEGRDGQPKNKLRLDFLPKEFLTELGAIERDVTTCR